MNFIQRLFIKAAVSVAQKIAFAPMFLRHAFSTITFTKLVTEGYRQNSAVSACATTLQLTFPEPPLLGGYEDQGRFVPDYQHPITTLLKNPNPDMGLAELLQFVIAYASIGGNLYLWKQRSVSGTVLALWPFSDAQITPVAGRDTSEGFVAYYEYDSGDGHKIEIPKSEIIHWKWMIDPLNPWKGIGAIALSAREVDRDNEATSYIFSLLKNNAVPPVVITLEDGDDSTQDEIDAMGQKWIAKHGKGQPAFISSGMKVEQMGYDLHKLAAETLADVPETRIAANFHVPPSVAGLNVGVKRSDYGDTAARKAFTEQTLMALWRSFASELYNGLKNDFVLKANFTLQFDLRSIGALQEQKTDKWTRITEAWKGGLLTRAQAKSELGLQTDAGDDVYMVSLATEFVSAGVGVVVRDSGKQSTLSIQQKSMKAKTGAQLLQRIRLDVAKRMTQAVDVYFSQLADRVVERAGKAAPDPLRLRRVPPNSESTNLGEEKAELPNAGDLLNGEDRSKLESIVKRFYVEVLQLSWVTWNYTLGIEKAFDLEDPLVAQLLKLAGQNVKEIHSTTMQEIRAALQYGNANGWSIDQLVRGDENQPGLRDIVDETYKGRARTIARTELGDAQNAATVSRYGDAGVKLVEILDGGGDDDDEECQVANGQIWTLAYFNAHRLEHPNCTRTAAPVFDDVKPDRG